MIVYTGPVISEVSRFVANGRLPAPIAFWKVVVDPKTQEWQAFLIQQRGHFHPGHIRRHEELKVFQTSIDEIERWSYVRLPLPATIDRKKIQPLWDSAVNLEKPGRIIPQCLEGATP